MDHSLPKILLNLTSYSLFRHAYACQISFLYDNLLIKFCAIYLPNLNDRHRSTLAFMSSNLSMALYIEIPILTLYWSVKVTVSLSQKNRQKYGHGDDISPGSGYLVNTMNGYISSCLPYCLHYQLF